jgi:hypothetical protein
MKDLPALAELLETLVENRDELEAHDGLHARKHHAGLVGGVRRLLFQRFPMEILHWLTAPR